MAKIIQIIYFTVGALASVLFVMFLFNFLSEISLTIQSFENFIKLIIPFLVAYWFIKKRIKLLKNQF